MRPRGRRDYVPMVGYLTRLMRPTPACEDRISWAKAKAWTIAAYRTKVGSDAAYLELAEALEIDAKRQLRQEAAARKRAPIRLTAMLPPALHLRLPGKPAWQRQAEHEWLATKATGGASQRTPSLRPKPAPAPISARVVARAHQVSDSQTVTPGHLLHPDEVYELAATLNARRL